MVFSTKKFAANSWQFSCLKYSDLEWFLEIRNSIRKNLHDNREFSIIETRAWYQNGMKDNLYYVVANRIEKVGYIRIKKEIETKKVLIGLDLHPLYHGKGLAVSIFQGAFKLVDELFRPNFIYLRVLKANNVAINLYYKLGFQICNETDLDLEMVINIKKLS